MKLKRLLCVILSVLLMVCSFSVVTSSATETKTTFNGRNVSVGDKVTVIFKIQVDKVCEDLQGVFKYGKLDSDSSDGIKLESLIFNQSIAESIYSHSYKINEIHFNGVDINKGYDFRRLTEFVTATFRITKANANYYAETKFNCLDATDGTAYVDSDYQVIKYFTFDSEVSVTELLYQTISAKSYTKVYGSGAFNLNAKAKTKLSYKSSNNNVAIVSSSGKVTLKGVGKATITITAALSTTYKPATKNITVTVVPKSVTKVSIKGTNNNSIIVKWNKVPNVDGYDIKVTSVSNGGSHSIGRKQNSTVLRLFNGKIGQKVSFNIRTYKKVGNKYYYSSWTQRIIKIIPPVTVKPVPGNSIKFKQSGSNIMLTWSKVSGANGYNFKISANSNGNKANYEKNITKTTLKLTNAKKGQKIKFSIRAYKKSNSKTYYSSWTTKTFVVR